MKVFLNVADTTFMLFNLVTFKFLPKLYMPFIYNLFTLFDVVSGISKFKDVCVLCASLCHYVTCTQKCLTLIKKISHLILIWFSRENILNNLKKLTCPFVFCFFPGSQQHKFSISILLFSFKTLVYSE